LLLSSDAFWKLLLCQIYEESFGRIITIYASRNEAVFCEVQTDFVSSPLARFTEKVHGALSRFMRSKTKLFALEFRRILEVPCLQFCRKFLGAYSRFLRLKTKLFAVKFRRILEVLCLHVLKKRFMAHIHDFCV